MRRTLVGLALIATIAVAQADNTSINGTVRAPTNSVVPNAKITLRNGITAQALSVKTVTSAVGS
jgi:hypothetical protein